MNTEIILMMTLIVGLSIGTITTANAQFYADTSQNGSSVGNSIMENATGFTDSDVSVGGGDANIVLLSQKLKKSSFGYRDLIGQVKNIGNGSATSIEIGVTVYDKNGDVIGTDSGYAKADTLKPGQKSTFTIMAKSDNFKGMESYELSLEWQGPNYDSQGYVENAQIYRDNSTNSGSD